MPAASATAMSWPTALMSWPSFVRLNQTTKMQSRMITANVTTGTAKGPILAMTILSRGLPHRLEVERVADAVAARQEDGGVPHRDHRAQHVEHEELVDAVDEEGEYVAGDHLPALSPVHDRAADPAQEDGDGQADQKGENEPLPAGDAPVDREDQADLPGHGAQRHAEVQAHAPRRSGGAAR